MIDSRDCRRFTDSFVVFWLRGTLSFIAGGHDPVSVV